jgi:hypothetical protein
MLRRYSRVAPLFAPVFGDLGGEGDFWLFYVEYFKFRVTIGTVDNFADQEILYGNLGIAFWTVCGMLYDHDFPPLLLLIRAPEPTG